MRLASSSSGSSSASRSPSPSSNPAKLSPTTKSSAAARRRMEKDLNPPPRTGYPLQRGSACLSCRKRKMKCDAGKPSCTQCVKANRAPDCDYDDGKSKSRTQLLQDKIAMLEGRIRELEGPRGLTAAASSATARYCGSSSNAASVALNAPPTPAVLYDHVVPGMVASSGGGAAASNHHAPIDPSPSVATLTLSYPAPSPSTPSVSPQPWMAAAGQYDLHQHHAADSHLQWVDMDPMSVTLEDVLEGSGRWWDAPQLPSHIQQLLVDIFLPHRRQCGFEVDPRRFVASLSSAHPPHTTLLNAIYALACHFSLSPLLTVHEMRFVARALGAIPDAMAASDSLLDVLQGTCLLATFFFIKGRLLEGCYHVGAAARLAIGLGLHQISAHDCNGASHQATANSSSGSAPASARHQPSSSVYPPPADAIELGERVLAFWQVYVLDRCWAVTTGLPVSLPDIGHPRTRIETPWPRSLEDYEFGRTSDADYGTMHIYSPGLGALSSSHDSTNALRAKAAMLFERAAYISTMLSTSPQPAEQLWVDFQSVDAGIARLSVNVPPVRGGRVENVDSSSSSASPSSSSSLSSSSRVDLTLVEVHALLDAATIQLHAQFALKDGGSQQKTIAAAAAAATMVHELDEADFPFLSPILGTCWTSVAEALVRELLVLRGAGTAGTTSAAANAGHFEQMSVVNRQLDVIVAGMNRLGATIPLVAYQASKVEQSRIVTF